MIDVAPTVLELTTVPEPTFVHGVQQSPMQGVSMAYSFDDSAALDRHTTQYFEMFGNRGIYHEGWTAVTRHSTPWVVAPMPTFDDDTWELYSPNADWTQSRNLAKERPEKLHELQELFVIEATRYNCLPLDDRRAERFNAEIAGRPELVTGDTQVLVAGMKRLSENAVIVLKNKSHSVVADVEMPAGVTAQGPIVEQGGKFGGWCLYAKNGRPKYCYNFLEAQFFYVEAGEALTAGRHQIRMDFEYDGGGVGKGGTVTLSIDGKQVGSGRVEHTIPFLFSCDEGTDVGCVTGTPVTSELGKAFNGKVYFVELRAGADDFGRLVTPEDLLKIVMYRQ